MDPHADAVTKKTALQIESTALLTSATNCRVHNAYSAQNPSLYWHLNIHLISNSGLLSLKSWITKTQLFRRYFHFHSAHSASLRFYWGTADEHWGACRSKKGSCDADAQRRVSGILIGFHEFCRSVVRL